MNYDELSKELAYAIRHAPWEYDLELEEEGWVSVQQLLESFNRKQKWNNLSETDLHNMIQDSEKKRYEIKNGKIRAYYGHSVSRKIIKQSEMPPAVLFHGTARRYLEGIWEGGLLSKGRQYVHLSMDIETAYQVGLRHDKRPVVLQIDALQAWRDGILFYCGNDTVWLADAIPHKYIKELSIKDSL